MSEDPRIAIFEAIANGTKSVTEGNAPNRRRTWFHHERSELTDAATPSATVWLIDHDDRRVIELRALREASDLPEAITDYLQKQESAEGAALKEAAERRAERGRRLVDRREEAKLALRTGAWLRLGEDEWLFFDPTLGYVKSYDAARLGIRSNADGEIVNALFNDESLAPLPRSEVPGDGVDAAARELAAIAAEESAIAAGTHGLGRESATGFTLVIRLAERWIRVHLDPDGRLERGILANPFARVLSDAQLREKLVFERARGERRVDVLVPVPEGLAQDLPELESAMERSKAEIIEDYLGRLRDGGRLGGGPTTDQRWTIERDPETDGFRIGGYRGEYPRLEYVWEPIDEAKIRKMLATYHMFGLHLLSD